MIFLKDKNSSDRNSESNIIDGKTLEKRARRTLKRESEIFSNTLGPAGMNTIVEDQHLKHVITKDGYTVYQNIVFYNKIDRVIARLIQKISGSLNEVVGDGTTSAVVCANELYRLKSLIKKHHITPKMLVEMIKEVGRYVEQYLENTSVKLFDAHGNLKSYVQPSNLAEIVKNLAAISLNNDYRDGELVSNLYMALNDPLNGSINVELSPSEHTSFDKERGFELLRGMIMSEMVTEADNKSAVYTDPYILLVKGQLMSTDAEALNKVINFVIGELGKPLVIIAGGFSKELHEIFRQSILMYNEKQHKILPLLAVEIDNTSVIGEDEFKDLAANVGGGIITVDSSKGFPDEGVNPEKFLASFGRCEKVVATMGETRIIGGKIDNAKVAFRVSEIDEQINHLKSEEHLNNYFNIFRLNRRKSALMNDMVTLKVGGNSSEEKENRSHLFDDAARGCRSALNKGITVGGNTAVARVCQEWLEDKNREVIKLISRCILNDIGYSDMMSYEKCNRIVTDIIKIFKTAYIRAYALVLNNKFGNYYKSLSIAKRCIKNGTIYNIVSGSYEFDAKAIRNIVDAEDDHNNDGAKASIDYMAHNVRVINSVETDTQILRVAISIIDLIISSNQLIRVPEMKKMSEHL